MASPASTRLGPYEIVSLPGKGGKGEVWKARDKRLQARGQKTDKRAGILAFGVVLWDGDREAVVRRADGFGFAGCDFDEGTGSETRCRRRYAVCWRDAWRKTRNGGCGISAMPCRCWMNRHRPLPHGRVSVRRAGVRPFPRKAAGKDHLWL